MARHLRLRLRRLDIRATTDRRTAMLDMTESARRRRRRHHLWTLKTSCMKMARRRIQAAPVLQADQRSSAPGTSTISISRPVNHRRG